MSNKVLVVGSYLSPYVRKVLIFLEVKGISYEIDPIIPFYGNSKFEEISPLRRIPVLIDGDVTLCDSSVICQYLEDKYPNPPLFPLDIVDRAKSRWIEEFADSRMGDVLIWSYYNELIIKKFVWGKEANQEILKKSLEEDIPSILNYLEKLVPSSGYMFKTNANEETSLSMADIAIGSFFKNAFFAKYTIDATKFPKTKDYISRIHSHPAFMRLKPFEELCLRTPIPKHRQAVASIRGPVSNTTFMTDKPVVGVMSKL